MPRVVRLLVSGPGSALVALALVTVALAVPAAARGRDLRLSSDWRLEPIRVDGNDEEWRGRTVPLEKQRFAVAFQNDGEALYLCLTTRDHVLATQIARQGLMVWLDPESGNRKQHQFGVHFPIDPRLAALHEGGYRWPRDGGEMNEGSQSAVGILGAGKEKEDATRVPMDEAGGILGRAAFHGDVLVYELKIPLKRAAVGPYALDAEPGATFRLEIQTPEWRGPLPPSRVPIGISAAGPAPGGRGVIGYPAVDARYLKQTDVKALVHLAAGQ